VDGDGIEVCCRYGIQDEQREITTAGNCRQGRAAQTLAYDARGRITGMTDGCGNHTGYLLDGWGRITAVETAEGGRRTGGVCLRPVRQPLKETGLSLCPDGRGNTGKRD